MEHGAARRSHWWAPSHAMLRLAGAMFIYKLEQSEVTSIDLSGDMKGS